MESLDHAIAFVEQMIDIMKANPEETEFVAVHERP
jgi:hypothetical protein